MYLLFLLVWARLVRLQRARRRVARFSLAIYEGRFFLLWSPS